MGRGIRVTYKNETGFPSVTEIINSACSAWIPSEFFTEKSAHRGTVVHTWCSSYAANEYCIPIKKEWRGYCESFKKWADAYLLKVILIEERLISKQYSYCGKLDLLCEMRGKMGRGLVDIKTGAKSKIHKLQIAAYRQLVKEQKLDTHWGSVLRLKEDGSMPITDDMPRDFSLDLNIFLSSFNIFQFFK